MLAILWDGFKKINGFLEIENSNLIFRFVDFNNSSLTLQISINEIETLKHYRLFSQEINGVELISKDGKRNVFVVENAQKLYKHINALL